MKSIILIIGIVSFLGACNGKLKIDNANNCLPTEIEERCKALGKTIKRTADDVPSWMLKLPNDDQAFYSAGTAVSRDMQLAIDKANLAAKRNLADRIGGELSSQIKEFVIEGGDLYTNDVITVDVERVTKNIMARINVAGYVPALYAHVRSSVAFKELEIESNEKRERDLEDTAAIIEAAGGSFVE